MNTTRQNTTTRPALWKTVTLGTVMAGMAAIGAGTAHAAPAEAESTTTGATVARSQTNGSTAIRTAPRPTAEIWTFGPDVSPVVVWLVAD